MLIIFILLTLIAVVFSGITTIPLSVGLLAVSTVLFQKSWVFFLAFGLGLFLDLTLIRPLGYTSLMFAIFVFTLFLYERKFETQTRTFIFFATFLGSLVYLKIFGGSYLLLQAFASALSSILLLKILHFGKLRKLSESD